MDNNNSIGQIERLVDRLARRVRLQRVINALTTALTVQILMGALFIALATPGWIDEASRNLGLLATFAIPLITALVAWFRPVDKISLAQILDRTHDLHDRLSTALFLADKDRNDFEEAQIRDASNYIGRVDIGLASPWRRPAEWVAFVVAACILAGVAFLKMPDHRRPLPADIVIQHDKILDDATLAMERERLEALKQTLVEAGLEDTKELIDQLDALLDRAENREVSEKEFLEELERIEKRFLDKDDGGREDMAEKLKEAAEELEKSLGKDLKQVPEAQALVDALKKKDYQKAADAMDALAKKMADPNVSSKELERLAKIMEKFADLIDPNDPKLQKLIEENQALADKLQKMFAQDKLGDSEKKRLNDAKKKLADLNRKKKANEGKLVSRQLKSLQRKTQEMAADAKQAAADKKQKGKKNDDPNAEKKPDFQQEAGKKAEDAARELEKEGKEQKKSEARGAAQKQLDELREAMQRSGVKREESKGSESKDEEKGKQMKEFLDKAKGKKPEEGKEGKDGQLGEKGDFKDGKPKSDANKGDDQKTEKKGTGAGKGDSQGLGAGSRELEDEKKLDSKRVDEKLEGKKGDGPTRSEVIQSASEEGFATTEYKDVYVDYESVVEEVMEKENVPKGYRFYIKRYFQLIRPQE